MIGCVGAIQGVSVSTKGGSVDRAATVTVVPVDVNLAAFSVGEGSVVSRWMTRGVDVSNAFAAPGPRGVAVGDGCAWANSADRVGR